MLLTKVFADEFMGDLLNRRSLLPCTKRQLSESLHPVFLPSHHISSYAKILPQAQKPCQGEMRSAGLSPIEANKDRPQ
jgi:hypothetical protein